MAKMEELSVLAKKVMAASVDAQFLGLIQVSSYLGMAFEEIVREAAELRTVERLEKSKAVGRGSEEEEVGS